MEKKIKEYKTTVRYSCGCKLITTTINYKPKAKEDKDCPHCFIVKLMGADYVEPILSVGVSK